MLRARMFVADQTKRHKRSPQDKISTTAIATVNVPAIMAAEVDAFDRPIRQSQFGDLTLMSLPIKCHLLLSISRPYFFVQLTSSPSLTATLRTKHLQSSLATQEKLFSSPPMSFVPEFFALLLKAIY